MSFWWNPFKRHLEEEEEEETSSGVKKHNPSIENERIYSCDICLQPYGLSQNRLPMVGPCGHDFCGGCIKKQDCCPLCKKSLNAPLVTIFKLIPPTAQKNLDDELDDLKNEISDIPVPDKNTFQHWNDRLWRSGGNHITCFFKNELETYIKEFSPRQIVPAGKIPSCIKNDRKILDELLEEAKKSPDENVKRDTLNNLKKFLKILKERPLLFSYNRDGNNTVNIIGCIFSGAGNDLKKIISIVLERLFNTIDTQDDIDKTIRIFSKMIESAEIEKKTKTKK